MSSSQSLDPTCRILTVSSSLSASLDLVKRVQALSSLSASQAHAAQGETELQVPWTISNKYYEADVHFLARPVKGLAPFQYHSIPALIFVWGRGEAYKHHIHRLQKDMNGTEPEVCLAVRVAAPSHIPDEDKEDEEDALEEPSAIDEFLSSNGFEFIDASSTDTARDDVEDDSIPSLPRVLDALSTIMWPTMQASQNFSQKAPLSSHTFLEWAQASFDASESSLDLAAVSSSPPPPTRTKGHLEMKEMAKWLEEDEKEDPWRSAELSASPTHHNEAHWRSVSQEVDAPSTPSGFDDDFSVFVTAPSSQATTTRETRASLHTEDDTSFEDISFDVSFDSDRLGPSASYDPVMYHSLGSHSDIGELLQDMPPDDDSHEAAADAARLDEDMPTELEIRQSAQRIFGAQDLNIPKHGDDSSEVDGDDFDLEPFDIGQVMSALQGMKAEISGMDDESERRKAAARVALGLVYGLEKDSGGDV